MAALRRHLIPLLLFAAVAYAVAPASGVDKRLVMPEHLELDGLLGVEFLRAGTDRLLSSPTRYYDTDVLYPDVRQKRTTEPFIGFVLLGLPFTTVMGLDDVRAFEALRWLLLWTSLVFAWRLLALLGADTWLAVTGALIIVLQPAVTGGFERVQVLSIPLIVGVLYFAISLWTPERPSLRHQWGLCATTTMYVMCGAYNVVITLAALLLLAPLTLRMVWALRGAQRLLVFVWPLAVAGIVNLLVLWPWLTDRWDMSAYMGAPFLAIKHWNAMRPPAWTLPLAPVFQGLVLILLAVFVWWQVRTRLDVPGQSFSRIARWTLAWMGLFVCTFSFGPSFESNTKPLATDLMRWVSAVIPQLTAAREFDRFWTFGMTLLMAAGVGTLGVVMHARGRMAQRAVAVAVGVVALTPLVSRPLAVTRPVEAAPWFVSLASEAPGSAGLYVHPLMQWNTPSCVLMIDAARQVGRPFVNGCLGIIPPWFTVATEVLHRFPDPEALWLLRKWQVDAVVDLNSARPVDVTDAFRVSSTHTDGRLFEILNPGPLSPHPSMATDALNGLAHIEVPWSHGPSGGILVAAPEDVLVWAVEVRFSLEQLVVHPIPTELVITADADRAPRLNRGSAGHWMQSLAADALLARTAPVATVALEQPHRGALRVIGGGRLPVDRIVLIGEQLR